MMTQETLERGNAASRGTTARLAVSVPKIRESAFRDAVKSYAEQLGYLVYFTWRSDHSPAGFPDLICVRDERMVVAELKVGKNKPTEHQVKWLDAFRRVEGVQVFLWYPDDWPMIEAVLASPPASAPVGGGKDERRTG